MAVTHDHDAGLADLLSGQDGVLPVDSAMKYLTRDALRWRITSGRWQQPCRGVVVAQSGPLTEIQVLRLAALWAGARGSPRRSFRRDAGRPHRLCRPG